MSLRASSGFRNKRLGTGRASVTGHLAVNTIAFTTTPDEITDSGTGLLTAGFLVGDILGVDGTANNDAATFTVTTAAAGALGVTPAPTIEAAGTVFSIAAAQGVTNGGLRDILRNGVLRIYSGTQPATADAAFTGTQLLEFTVDGGVFAHGAAANGINWDDAVLGVIDKAAAETWRATGLADGTAGYFRFCANPADTGLLSTTLSRIDGSVGTSGADMLVVSTAIVTSDIYFMNSSTFTDPMQYGL